MVVFDEFTLLIPDTFSCQRASPESYPLHKLIESARSCSSRAGRLALAPVSSSRYSRKIWNCRAAASSCNCCTLIRQGWRSRDPYAEWTGITYAVTSGEYFQALGIKIRTGRVFTAGDTATSQPVVVINNAAARKYFGSKNPVGEQIEPVMWNGAGSTTRLRTVIGVVGDVKLQGIGSDARPTVYWPLQQIPSSDTLHIVIRTTGDPLHLLSVIRTQIRALDKTLPLYGVQPLTEVVRGSLAQPLHVTALVSTFGILALILSSIGVFGVVAYSVVQRTREIGVRMALGAQRKDIFRDLLIQALVISAIGFVIGLPIAAGTARFLRGSLFGVPVQESLSLALAGLVLLGAILTASFFPALRGNAN